MRLLTNAGRESWKPKSRTQSREDLLSMLSSQDAATEGRRDKIREEIFWGRYFISRSSWEEKSGIACDHFRVKKKKSSPHTHHTRILCDDTKDEGSGDGRAHWVTAVRRRLRTAAHSADLGEAWWTFSVGGSPQVVVGQDSSTHTN